MDFLAAVARSVLCLGGHCNSDNQAIKYRLPEGRVCQCGGAQIQNSKLNGYGGLDHA